MKQKARNERFLLNLGRVLPLLLSIFLTVVPAFSAPSAVSSCASVYQQPLVWKRLPLSAPQILSRKKWDQRFGSVSSYQDFENELAKLKNEMKGLDNFDWESIQSLDLVQIVEGFSPLDQMKVKALSEAVAQRIRKKRVQTAIDYWLYPLDFYFHPEELKKFFSQVESISQHGILFQEAYSGNLGPWAVNRTFESAIQKAPTTIQSELRAEIHRQILNVGLNNELMVMNKQKKLQVPVARVFRRNLEVLAFFLLKPSIQKMTLELSKSPDQKSKIQTVDQYFQSVSDIFGPQRGGYSFAKVVEAARLLQKNLRPVLNKDFYSIDMYGSFINGKAAFQTSDLDLHLSPELLMDLSGMKEAELRKEPFSLYFSDFIQRHQVKGPAALLEFWKRYQDSESEIAQNIFHRAPERPSELMTTLIPQRQYSNDSLDYRWYNPLVLHLTNQQIQLQILQLGGSHPGMAEFSMGIGF